MVREPDATTHPTLQDHQLMSKHRVLGFKPQLRLWRGTGWPERNKATRSFRQFRRFHHVINSNKVFGTHRVLAGGCRIGNRGYFFPLTVLADVPDNARAMNEEPFGPLALVNPVRNLDEAIEKANSLPYGLAAYAFTCSSNNAHRLANDVEAGNLSINHFVASVAETPFGGVKDSGYGREGGTEGLCCYTVAKSVSHKMVAVAALCAQRDIPGVGRAMKRSKCRTTAMTTTILKFRRELRRHSVG